MNVKNDKIQSGAYLDYIKTKPCVGCGKEPVDAHHVRPKGTGSGWQNDFTAAPFCRQCHTEWHSKGATYYEAKHRVNVWRECFYLLLEYWITEGRFFDGEKQSVHIRDQG